jgi:diguanylate cyclase (GGDEF)-like protein/PAS domain S-box-containing protein
MRDVVIYTLMFSAMLQLLMAAYAWGRRNEPAAKPLILVFVLGAVWAFGYGMDMASSDLQIKIRWMQIYWTATSFGPLIFLLIVLEHVEISHLLTRLRLAVLLLPSVLLIVLVWSLPHHQLLMYDFTVEHVAALDILQKKNGILFDPIFLVLQGMSLVSYYLLIRSLPSANQIKRRQSITILCALLIPFLVNIPTILDINPIKGFDFTPHALVLSSGLFAFAIFGYRWLDILPLARTALVESIPVGVIVIDAKNRIVDINPSAKQFLQVGDSIVGQESQKALARFDPILHSQTDERFNKEIKVELPTGQPRYIDFHIIPLKNREGQFNGSILTLNDVTQSKKANERLQVQLAEIESLHAQLHEQAIRDALTGLFNRGYLNDMLERETHRAQRHQHPLSLLMIEIDSFKRFNDNFGHEAGDVTLQQVAQLIRANTRTDDIACRFGGDEFTLIMPETTLESAVQCAERLRESAAILPLHYDGKLLGNLTLSIGVAVFPKHGETGALALRAADEAMYQAKQAGKNRVIVAKD